MPLDIKPLENGWALPLWHWRSHKLSMASAKAVIFATGGVAGIYWRSTNPPGMVGDGHALALKAGAKLIDMEFIQFFPFALADRRAPSPPIPILVKLQGRILNTKGEDLAEKYGAPYAIEAVEKYRDLLSRIIMQELQATGSSYVLLDMDLSLLGNFADLLNLKASLKSAPAAHFSMGGILTDIDGYTGVQRIYAAGEAMGSVHGANRLAMNALTAAAVFGFRAGEAAAKYTQNIETSPLSPGEELFKEARAKLAESQGNISSQELLEELQKCMWNHAGILCSEESLLKAKEVLDEIQRCFELAAATSKRSLLARIELENALAVASSIVDAALLRRESRGAHYRLDFPSEDASFKNVATLAALQSNGEVKVTLAERRSAWL